MYEREVQPPKGAKWLLDLFTPYEEAESIHGDLLEEFSSLAVAKGSNDARRWYWRQCLKSVVHLFPGAFRRSPWRLVGAMVIGQLSLWLGSNLPEDGIFGTLHLIRNHVTPYHPDWYAYVMWLNYDILFGRLLLCFVIGLLVAFIAKGGELVAAICVNVLPNFVPMAILAFARNASPHIHPALVPMLLHKVEFSIMIVLGGWVVRDMRVARLRPPSTSAYWTVYGVLAVVRCPSVGDTLSLRKILSKVFLCIALGGHSVLGLGMSQEKIEELLRAMNRTWVEVSVSDDDETNQASGPLGSQFFQVAQQNRPVEQSDSRVK